MPIDRGFQQDLLLEFFETAQERYLVRQRKLAGETQLTDDFAFQNYRFCNVHREHDRVTIWVKENIREPLRNDPRVFLAMCICRWFNRIETMQALLDNGLFHNWNMKHAAEVVADIKPVTNAAYVIHSPYGKPKGAGICEIIDNIAQEADRITQSVVPGVTTLEDMWRILHMFPSAGVFMSYEVVSDLRHTYICEKAPDIMTWASPGPGACNGLSFLTMRELGKIYPRPETTTAALYRMQELLSYSQDDNYWPQEWDHWEMREVEHWLCEYAKWVRIMRFGGRGKRGYP
jgi:hypothetical protein